MMKYIRRFMFDFKTNSMLLKKLIKGILTSNNELYEESKFFLKMHLSIDFEKVWDEKQQMYVYKTTSKGGK